MSYVPDLDANGMLSSLGSTIANNVKQYRQKQLLSELGKDLMGGDYQSAAAKALQAGDMGTGLKLMELGRQRQSDSTLSSWIGGGGLGGAAGGAQQPSQSPTAPTPLGKPAPVGGFDQAVSRTLEFEGGLNKRDTNGTPSNFGINAAANPGVNVLSLTQDGAKSIYKTKYWDEIDGDELRAKNPALAHVAFDTAVIAGPGKANDLLEKANGDPNKLLDLRKQFQDSLIARDPQRYGPYAKAWNNRIAALRADVNAGGAGAAPQSVQVADASGKIPPLPIIQKMLESGNPGFKAIGEAYLKRAMEQDTGGKEIPVTDPDTRKRLGFGADDKRPIFQNSITGKVTVHPDAKESDNSPQSVREYKYAKENGYEGSYQDFITGVKGSKDIANANKQREAEGARMGLKGEDLQQYVLNGKVQSAAEKQTEGQANAALYARRMAESDKILNDPRLTEAMMSRANIAKGSIPVFGNSMVPKEYQLADQAKRDFVNATLRRESGAAISQSEFDNANKQYFPQPGDSPDVIAQKAKNRKTSIEGIANAAAPSFREEFFGTKKPGLGVGLRESGQAPEGPKAPASSGQTKSGVKWSVE